MVSEESESLFPIPQRRHYRLFDSLDSLDSELVHLRESVDRLRLSNENLVIEINEFRQGITELNQSLNNLRSVEEEVQVQAQPIQEEDLPLQIGNRVRITSRQQFGVEGTIHSFTSQRVRITIEGRRRPVIRSRNNLVRIPTSQN